MLTPNGFEHLFFIFLYNVFVLQRIAFTPPCDAAPFLKFTTQRLRLAARLGQTTRYAFFPTRVY